MQIRMDLLLEKRRSLEKDKSAISAMRRGCKRRLPRVVDEWRLTERMERVVIICYVECQFKATAAVEYLLRAGRQRHWSPKSKHELSLLVERIFLKYDAIQTAAWLDFAESSNLPSIRIALEYSRQAYVVGKATEANESRGVAPSSAILLCWASEFDLKYPAACRPKPLGLARDNVSKKWLHKIRIRYGGRFRALPPALPTAFAECQRKVRYKDHAHRARVVRDSVPSRFQ